jgi:endonuclease YncB( thermonuclease family)
VRRWAPVVLGIVLAVWLGWFGHSGRTTQSEQIVLTFSGQIEPRSFPCTVATAEDGATFTCDEHGDNGRPIRVRLAGLDVRTQADACAPGRPCASAHSVRSIAALTSLARGQLLTCQENRLDYGGAAAFCRRPDNVDLSCAMVRGGYVARWDRFWGDHRC